MPDKPVTTNPGFYTRSQIEQINPDRCTCTQIRRLKEMALAYHDLLETTKTMTTGILQIDPNYTFQGRLP